MPTLSIYNNGIAYTCLLVRFKSIIAYQPPLGAFIPIIKPSHNVHTKRIYHIRQIVIYCYELNQRASIIILSNFNPFRFAPQYRARTRRIYYAVKWVCEYACVRRLIDQEKTSHIINQLRGPYAIYRHKCQTICTEIKNNDASTISHLFAIR